MNDVLKPIISIRGLGKTYDGGHQALKGIDLDVKQGEILALLGPNGAGKTTLISTICGLVSPSTGNVLVDGHDIIDDYRITRKLIGLVPQELTLGAFDVVFDTLKFSRGLFGLPPDNERLNQILSDLSLQDKKFEQVNRLSGGMKRRVLIAKALAHEPRVLFLDEPTAGVDVELRKDMWSLVETLRKNGVTIILTTHYIEEAEEIADRVGVISDGRLLVIDEKKKLMSSLGKKQLTVQLRERISQLPQSLSQFDLDLSEDGEQLTYHYSSKGDRTGITSLLQAVSDAGLGLRDLQTSQSSLEDIFVELVHANQAEKQQ
ncbi:MAG: ABC transporter ATP-binding protein [Granulosicoccus sp.]|nr:ABC transporter ATP-binding protein [Granulosicoccus sp.]